jgi:hypothetical protein
METKEHSKNRQHKSKKSKKLKIFGIVLCAIVIFSLLLIIFVVPAYISSGSGRNLILAVVNKSIPGRANFSGLSVGWLKGIKVADFSFNDNTGQISVEVKQVSTEPHYGSLLGGNLSFGRTTIDQPNIKIDLKEQKQKQPAAAVPVGKTAAPAKAAGFAFATDLVVNNGNVKITDLAGKTLEVKNINTQASVRPLGGQSSLNLAMVVAQADKPSEVKVSGQVTPGKQTGWTLKGTNGEFSVDITDLKLDSLAPLLALAGLKWQAEGLMQGHIKSQVKDGQVENVDASVKAVNLKISGQALKGDSLRTGVLDAQLRLTGKNQAITIDNLKVKTDWADLAATGLIPATAISLDSLLDEKSNYVLNGDFNCDVAAIVSQMPATIGLKETAQLTSGRISGNIQTLTQGGSKQIQASAKLTDMKGTVQDKQISLSQPVAANAKFSPKQLGLNVSSSFASINCEGSLESIKYDSSVNFAQLQSEFGSFVDMGPYKIAGTQSGSGKVSVTEKTIGISGVTNLKNISLTGPNNVTASVPVADINYDMAMDRKGSGLNIESIKAVTSFGRIDIQKAVVPLGTNTQQPMNLAVNAADIDLSKLLPFAIMSGSVPKDVKLTGIVQSQIAVTSEKNTYTIKTDSTKIKGLKLTYPDKTPFEQSEVSVVLEAQINPEQKAINLKKFQLESPQIKINEVRLNQTNENGKTKLSGQAQLVYDWSALKPVISPYMPAGLTVSGKRQDMITFSSEYPSDKTDMMLSNLNAKAAVGFEQAEYMGLNIGKTNVNVDVNNGLLVVSPFTTKVNNGQMTFGAQANFKVKPALFKTTRSMQVIKDINIDDKTTRLLLMYLNPIFANAVRVSGIANLSCDKLSIPLDEKAKNSAEIVGVVSISQLRLQASDLLGQIIALIGGSASVITVHPTKFTLKDGLLKYDDMQMDIGDTPVNFKGVIGLDKSLDMTVTLPYTLSGTTARTNKQTRGTRITLPLTGTVDRPKIDTSKLLESQGPGLLEDVIQKGLDELFK